MAKVQTCVNIDEITKIKLRKLGIEVSPFVNRILGNLINLYEGGDVNIIEIKERLDEIQRQKWKLLGEEAELITAITQHEDKIKKDVQEHNRRVDREMDAIKASGILGDLPL